MPRTADFPKQVSTGLHRWTVLLGLLVLQTHAATAGGETAPGSGEDDVYFGDLPIVLSATRLSQPLTEVPVAITVIDREMIEASGARELADVFRLVPGFVVGSVNGHQRMVGYHGLLDAFNRRMQVLVDGRSVYTSTFGGVRWTDLSLALEDIERIEVVRGPNAATYGPNSFLGVISIKTRHALEDGGNAVKFNMGSDGIADAYYRHGGSVGDFDYRVSVKAAADSGFENHHDDKLVQLITFRGDYQASNEDSFEFHAGVNKGPREVEATLEREEQGSSYFVQGLWRHAFSSGNEVRLQLYHNNYTTKDTFFTSETATVPPFGPIAISSDIDFSRTGRRTDIEFQHVFTASPDIDVVWGAELRRDEAISQTFWNSPDPITNDVSRLFGNLNWEFSPGTHVSFGVMAEENDITGTSVSPRLALNHQVKPGHTLRASYSTATRTPSLFESRAYYGILIDTPLAPPLDQLALLQYIGPDTLDAEEIEAIDLGYIFSLPRYHLTGDLRLFREKIENLFTDRDLLPAEYPADFNGVPILTGSSQLHTGVNGDSVVIRGLEVQLEYRPTSRDRLYLGYANLDADSTNLYDRFQTSVPEETFSLMWLHRYAGGASTVLAYYSVDEIQYTDNSQIIEEQHRLDFRVVQSLKLGGHPAEFSLTFQNILGQYQDYSSTNLFDTRAYISFLMQF